MVGPAPNPSTGLGATYQFHVKTVGTNSVTFIDPFVAVGYEYATGPGDPNFASVLLPNVGNGRFDLSSCDASILGTAYSGVPFGFGPAGLNCFQVRGIETSADLDPDDFTAFITGLTFTADGAFTGTMTPLITAIASVPCRFLTTVARICVELI